MYSNRWFSVILICILLILSSPTPVSATTCLRPFLKIIAECKAGTCRKGFKIEQRSTSELCEFLPYVVDLNTDEDVEVLFTDVFRAKHVEKTDGIFELSVRSYCNWVVLDEQTDSMIQNCKANAEYITLVNLSEGRTDLNIDVWRQNREKEVLIERVWYVTRYVSVVIFVFGLFSVLPFLLIRKRLKNNQPLRDGRILIIIQCILVTILCWGNIFILSLSTRITILTGLILIAVFVEVIYILWTSYAKRTKRGHKQGT